MDKKTQKIIGMLDGSRNSEDITGIAKLLEEYSNVFGNGALDPMETEPMEIKPKENYVPKSFTVPRKVP